MRTWKKSDERELRRIMANEPIGAERKMLLGFWFADWKRENGILPAVLPDKKTLMKLRHVPVDTLELSTRTYNGLRRCGVHTVGALLSMREDEVRDLRFIGARCYEEIEDVLALQGWRLAPPQVISDFEKWLERKR